MLFFRNYRLKLARKKGLQSELEYWQKIAAFDAHNLENLRLNNDYIPPSIETRYARSLEEISRIEKELEAKASK